MFSNQIAALSEELYYHLKAQEELEHQIAQVKCFEALAKDAAARVEEAIENIGGKYLDLFREQLLSLFPTETTCCHQRTASIEVKDKEELVVSTQDNQPQSTEVVPLEEDTLELPNHIHYDPHNHVAYIGFSNKNRARNYGDFLTRLHTVGSKYVVRKPQHLISAKHELVVNDISYQDTIKLIHFDIQKEPEANPNPWQDRTREPEPAIRNTGYKKYPLEQLELADIVSKNPSGECLYEVIQNHGTYVTVRCIQHSSLPGLVGQEYGLSEAYLVAKGENFPALQLPSVA